MSPRRTLNGRKIEEIFHRFANANPAPKTELVYTNPYTLLIAVVLSAHATDASVNRATADLFRVASTPEAMVKLGLAKIVNYIRQIGLFRNKAKNVLALSKDLIEKHHSRVPRTRDDLEALPGVGRKTANVILNSIFGEPVIAVDTHIFRVANRTGLAAGKTPLAVEQGLQKVIPENYKVRAHHWLVLHGRYVCTARKPHCPECLIQDICIFPDKTKPLPKRVPA